MQKSGSPMGNPVKAFAGTICDGCDEKFEEDDDLFFHIMLRRHIKSERFDLRQENAKLKAMIIGMGDLLESAIPAMISNKKSLIFKTEDGEEEPAVMLSGVDHGFILEEYRIWKEGGMFDGRRKQE